jgi:hypothetical protein
MATIVRRWSILGKRFSSTIVGQYTGVILKDLARTATLVVKVRLRCALDPSQAQMTPIIGK